VYHRTTQMYFFPSLIKSDFVLGRIH